MERLQKATILKDLERKMVFLTGPRQIGKTWLAREIGKGFKKTVYLNYDSTEDRRIIREEGWPPEMELLILDELHKMKGWKNWLKGVWDTREKGLRILVTGSARLEVFRQSGDSLAGRFLRHRLLPFSVAEIGERGDESVVARLMDRGGFPEPFLAESDQDADRWRLQYADGLIREDIFDLERVRNLRAMRTIVELLRSRVGSPVSFVSLAEDTGVAPNTVRKYIEMLESLYIVFRITPHARSIARSLRKEPKIYFFDTGMVLGGEGARFENLMAVSLLKHVFALADLKGKSCDLNYLRTRDGEEVDFCVVEDGKPLEMLEIKLRGPDPGRTIYRFHEKYGIPAGVVFRNLKHESVSAGVRFRRARDYLAGLAL